MDKVKVEGNLYRIYCEACQSDHSLNNTWSFNNDFDKPTFSPSILVTWTLYDSEDVSVKKICHSFVVDGVWQYLSDCTHDKASMHVPLIAHYESA